MTIKVVHSSKNKVIVLFAFIIGYLIGASLNEKADVEINLTRIGSKITALTNKLVSHYIRKNVMRNMTGNEKHDLEEDKIELSIKKLKEKDINCKNLSNEILCLMTSLVKTKYFCHKDIFITKYRNNIDQILNNSTALTDDFIAYTDPLLKEIWEGVRETQIEYMAGLADILPITCPWTTSELLFTEIKDLLEELPALIKED